MNDPRNMVALVLLVSSLTTSLLAAGAPPAGAPVPSYHLTARPWRELAVPRTEYLERIEGVVRFSVRHQNAAGAMIDPVIHTEQQYATPYYAHAVGTLLHAGRARDLADSGIRAMEWATACFQKNQTNGHRVFYITPLVEALDLYAPFVPPATLDNWRTRLKTTVDPHEAPDNNWSTYLMKGDWLRARTGLMERASAVDRIEHQWDSSQRRRISDNPLSLYHDITSWPDTLAVEVVGRGNLLALIQGGYDGPSAKEIRQRAEAGTRSSLLLQDPSGQMPCNGRTDDHVWGDVGYQLAYEVMAERCWAAGDRYRAGQYRHGAMLTFRNIDRWRRTDGVWAGSYYVTKNHFDPALRIGYQGASQYSNYNGALMHHLAEAFATRQTDIPEQPAPVEIGGYAFPLDDQFATAFANAGGTQMEIDLRADTSPSSGNKDCWNALGVVRLGRVNWDTRLGPSDGTRSGATGLGVSFAPTFEENGQWVRLASVPDRYQGRFSVRSVHPLLVRCAVDYAPHASDKGPSFHQEFVLTPDGIFTKLTRTAGTGRWGVTLPLLENDGGPVEATVDVAGRIARTRYAARGDEQNFIILDGDTLTAEAAVRSAVGDLKPVRAVARGESLALFVYPRSPADPSAERVRDTFRVTPTGFTSTLGTVSGDVYLGRTAAGGVGDRMDLSGPGRLDATFSKPCGFILQLAGGKVVAVEADRDVTASVQGSTFDLHDYTPVRIASGAPR